MRVPYIDERLKAANPDHVAAIKKRLLLAYTGASADCPDGEPKQWLEAITNIDSKPELLTRCNEILSSIIIEALNELEGNHENSFDVNGFYTDLAKLKITL